MRIGVLSDTHDNLPMIDRALRVFEERGVETVLHLGDFVSPFALRRILKGLRVPLYGVFGNNDGDKLLLKGILGDRLFNPPVILELGAHRVLLTHELQEGMGKVLLKGGLRAVFFGHTHSPHVERDAGGLLLNPGECSGWLGGKGTVAVCDLEDLRAEIIEL